MRFSAKSQSRLFRAGNKGNKFREKYLRSFILREKPHGPRDQKSYVVQKRLCHVAQPSDCVVQARLSLVAPVVVSLCVTLYIREKS
jgi:hypothetical protein